MLRLQVPLTRHQDVIRLIHAGADEFYCGLVQTEKEMSVIGSNRRSYDIANFHSVPDLISALDIAHEHKKQVFLTMNSHFYTPNQLGCNVALLRELVPAGIDGVIIADIGMALIIRKIFPNLMIIGGTGLHLMNSKAIGFYGNIGISRFILPRQLNMQEIDNLVSSSDSEFEVFIKNEYCTNIDGLCRFGHGKIKGRCFDLACVNIRIKNKNETIPNFNGFSELRCGACSMFEFSRLNITALKIVGRDAPVHRTEKDVIFLKRCIDLVDKCVSKQEYSQQVRLFHKEVYGFSCNDNCYYPEERSHEEEDEIEQYRFEVCGANHEEQLRRIDTLLYSLRKRQSAYRIICNRPHFIRNRGHPLSYNVANCRLIDVNVRFLE